MGRRTGSRRSRRRSPGLILAAFFAGAVAILVLLSHADWTALRGSGPKRAKAPAEVPLEDLRAALAESLTGLAEWEPEGPAGAACWKGRLPADASLVRWNAEVTAALKSAGLEVVSGTEELIPRRGRWPIQRLSLEVEAASGEFLARVVVEAARRPSLPPAF